MGHSGKEFLSLGHNTIYSSVFVCSFPALFSRPFVLFSNSVALGRGSLYLFVVDLDLFPIFNFGLSARRVKRNDRLIFEREGARWKTQRKEKVGRSPWL